MVRLVIRIREKDVGILGRSARKAGMSKTQYLEEVVEVWLSRKRKEEKTWTATESTCGPSSGTG